MLETSHELHPAEAPVSTSDEELEEFLTFTYAGHHRDPA
jgi:hypothetical protein